MTTLPASWQPRAAGVVPEFSLGDRLRKARELTGLDGTEFAAEVGISRTSVYAAERGEKRPRELTLRAWALCSGVDLTWLKTGETPPPAGDGVSVVHPPGLEPGTNWHATRFAQVTSIDDARSMREPVAGDALEVA